MRTLQATISQQRMVRSVDVGTSLYEEEYTAFFVHSLNPLVVPDNRGALVALLRAAQRAASGTLERELGRLADAVAQGRIQASCFSPKDSAPDIVLYDRQTSDVLAIVENKVHAPINKVNDCPHGSAAARLANEDRCQLCQYHFQLQHPQGVSWLRTLKVGAGVPRLLLSAYPRESVDLDVVGEGSYVRLSYSDWGSLLPEDGALGEVLRGDTAAQRCTTDEWAAMSTLMEKPQSLSEEQRFHAREFMRTYTLAALDAIARRRRADHTPPAPWELYEESVAEYTATRSDYTWYLGFLDLQPTTSVRSRTFVEPASLPPAYVAVVPNDGTRGDAKGVLEGLRRLLESALPSKQIIGQVFQADLLYKLCAKIELEETAFVLPILPRCGPSDDIGYVVLQWLEEVLAETARVFARKDRDSRN